MARNRTDLLDHRGGATAGGAKVRHNAESDVVPPTDAMLALQSSAGNRAVATAMMPPIQRLWDPADTEKSDPESFSWLLSKMDGLTPTLGRSRLSRLAAKTDTPEQLRFILGRIGVASADRCLAVMDGATLHKFVSLAPNPTAFAGASADVIRFGLDLAALFSSGPTSTFADVVALINTKKSDEGLISAKGTQIAQSTVSGVVGDGKADEKAAVKAAVEALDAGTLFGVTHNNRDGDLPGIKGAGGYTEHDVAPPKGVTNRGERRLVVSDAKKYVYYTWNHYGKDGKVLPAFIRIR